MTRTKTILAVVVMSLIFMSQAKADWGIKYGIDKFKTSNTKERSVFEKDLKFQQKVIGDLVSPEVREKIKDRSDSPVKFYIDLKGGAGSTSANITPKSGAAYNTASKVGLDVGGLVYLSLFDVVKFSTGLGLSNKSFQIQPTIAIPSPDVDTTSRTLSNQYLDIPMNINFGGMISDKVGIMFNGGPYFGILMNQPEQTGTGLKNFDLGLNGTLTANYKLNLLTSIIFGVNFDYGGLNNLGSTQYVDKVTTTKIGLFTGVRFGID